MTPWNEVGYTALTVKRTDDFVLIGISTDASQDGVMFNASGVW
jgi:hypothetical protein